MGEAKRRKAAGAYPEIQTTAQEIAMLDKLYGRPHHVRNGVIEPVPQPRTRMGHFAFNPERHMRQRMDAILSNYLS